MEIEDLVSGFSGDPDLAEMALLIGDGEGASSSDDDNIARSNQRAILQIQYIRDTEANRRRESLDRNREKGAQTLWEDYFAPNCIYKAEMFRRRFRMRRQLFDRILGEVCAKDRYFVQKTDAAGVRGLTPHQKITAALRMLAYGASADSIDEYIRIGETTALLTMKKFCKAIVDLFQARYCRSPTAEDVAKLNEENSERGFPGMLGSVDCMHWTWKNCPTAFAGQYSGHHKKPTIVLEAVASRDLWFWHAFFGMPGSNNDLNVLHRSYLFDELLSGRAPPCNFVIEGKHRSMGYYLGDGIYPEIATIVKTFTDPICPKRKKFAEMQEGARKDVERAFGVLQARWAIIRNPARLWKPNVLAIIMKACIILHNMIVEDERDTGIRQTPEAYEQGSHNQPVRAANVNIEEYMSERLQRVTTMHDRVKHLELREDLVQHIWYKFGGSGPSA